MSKLRHCVDTIYDLSNSNSVTTQTDPFEYIDRSHLEKDVVILQPITMRIPNNYDIYFPSKLRSKKEINYEEFLLRYADTPKKVRVCFDISPSLNAILQNSRIITAYNFGLDCWYIVVPDNVKDGMPVERDLSVDNT